MNKKERFFFKSSAVDRAVQLRSKGYKPDIYPAHNFGPRGCFHWPFGWDVVWFEG